MRISLEVDTADFDQLLERVEKEGAHVTLTRDDVAVAALVPWFHYRRAREGLARLEVAYWTAWTDQGTFDAEALRQTVADLVEDRWPSKTSPDEPPAESPTAPEPGDA